MISAAEAATISRLRALIFFRAFFVSLLLGSAFVFRVELFAEPRKISFLIISLYVLTIVYALLLSRTKKVLLFAYLQLIFDLVAEITLIYITGGIDSWFSFTLILTVLSSSIVVDRRAGYFMASMAGILYGILIDLQFYSFLPIPYAGVIYEQQIFYNIFIHIVALYCTAFLAGYLSEKLAKTEERLEQKDSHLKDLEFFNIEVIESLPSGLFTTDEEGMVQIFNRAAEKITGTQKDNIMGKSIAVALPFLVDSFNEGRNEKILLLPEGKRKVIGITISALRDIGGNRTGFIGVFQDLTQLKEMETEMKQKEKLAAIGELSANIAHEIRNPLASLRGSIEMLREGKIPEKHRARLMDIAIGEMERLNSIITDFLSYSRPKPVELQNVDIHGLLNDTIDLLKNSEQNRGNIECEKKFSGELIMCADPGKMRQVFWNLGLNAMEALAEGGRLTVSTRSDGDSVHISFKDTGPGLDPDEIPKIFYPFYTTKERGTGLGLAIAYRLIEEHQGRLTVQSTTGKGSVFEIILNRNHGQ